MLLHPRLVYLDYNRTGGGTIIDHGFDGLGVGQRHRFLVLVVVVLGLLTHRKRPRHGRLDLAVGISAQNREIAKFDGVPPFDRTDHARHRNRSAATINHRARLFDIDAVESGSKAIGIAFAPLLAVTDDVDPGAFLIVDGENRGV